MKYKVTFYRTITVNAESQLQAEKQALYDLGFDLIEPIPKFDVKISKVK